MRSWAVHRGHVAQHLAEARPPHAPQRHPAAHRFPGGHKHQRFHCRCACVPTAFSISSVLPYSGHIFQNAGYLQGHTCHALAPCAIHTGGLGSAHPAAGTQCRLCCHAEVLDPIKESKESVAIDVRSGGTTGQGMGSPSQSASTSLPREKHSMLSQALATSISPR